MSTTTTTKRPVGKPSGSTKTNSIVKENINLEKKYESTDMIWTTSVTAGELIMIGKKTKNVYTWSDLGDKTEVEYQDLTAARASKDPYLLSPLFMIDDEELLESKGWERIKEAYKQMYKIEEIEEIFNLDLSSFKKVIKELPKGLINTIKTMAAEKIENKTLDSISKINILDELLGTDLKLYLQ